ncbi:DUF3551 domain-containing protein [Bradyrhizobium sp. LHD-71]|uniref:DUF3551 domain-containing protein n=1 Tax=Bradyrhizobium sp. LHD-71 TaxID=3072141 RepID=UPI0035BE5553
MFIHSTRLAALALLSLASVVTNPAPAAAGVEYPFCMMQGRHTPQSCTFTTIEQCRASLVANSGFCEKNPRYFAVRPGPTLRPHPSRRASRSSG